MKLFSRSKESSDPAIIINNCLKTVVNRISDSLDEDEYHWMKPWGVKRFESIILAKFMLDYSFNKLAEDRWWLSIADSDVIFFAKGLGLNPLLPPDSLSS